MNIFCPSSEVVTHCMISSWRMISTPSMATYFLLEIPWVFFVVDNKNTKNNVLFRFIIIFYYYFIYYLSICIFITIILTSPPGDYMGWNNNVVDYTNAGASSVSAGHSYFQRPQIKIHNFLLHIS